MHAGRANTYTFTHAGKKRTLKPMADDKIQSDVILVVRKEKVHKTTSRSRAISLQEGENDVGRITNNDILSIPVVDKPVDGKPLNEEKKDDAVYATFSTCIDKGIQTDDVHDEPTDRVSFQKKARVVDDRRNEAKIVRWNKGKDGRIRMVCGPDIALVSQDYKKKVDRKFMKFKEARQGRTRFVWWKKEAAPKFKLIWRRKEAPSTAASQASRKQGCGVAGRQDLKKSGDVADRTPHAEEDLAALRTTPFQGGKDDAGI